MVRLVQYFGGPLDGRVLVDFDESTFTHGSRCSDGRFAWYGLDESLRPDGKKADELLGKLLASGDLPPPAACPMTVILSGFSFRGYDEPEVPK